MSDSWGSQYCAEPAEASITQSWRRPAGVRAGRGQASRSESWQRPAGVRAGRGAGRRPGRGQQE